MQLKKDAGFCSNCGQKQNIDSQSSDIVTLFEKQFSKLLHKNIEVDESDLRIYPDIPDDIKSEFRENFDIPMRDEILFIRDTSFWSSKNQGLVLTNTGLVCIPDNDKPDENIQFDWIDIDHVEYKEHILYFFIYEDDDPACSISIVNFYKGTKDKYKKAGDIWASVLTEIAKLTGEPEKSIIDEIDELIENDQYEEALSLCNTYIKDEDKNDIPVRYELSVIHYNMGNYIKALDEIQETIERSEGSEEFNKDLFYNLKGEIYKSLDNPIEARKDFVKAMSLASSYEERRDYKKAFQEMDAIYTESFLKQKYSERKLLCFNNEFTDLSQQTFAILDIKCPLEFSFPTGHPVVNQLYIGHPFIPHKYIPFQEHEMEFANDRIREFCLIMQFLGATELTVENISSASEAKQFKEYLSASGGVSRKVVSLTGDFTSEKEGDLAKDIKQSLNLSQKFRPFEYPVLPDNLIWYPNEASWQRLYQQRMQGSLLEHRERIETSKNRVVHQSELIEIEAELNSLLLNAHGKLSKEKEQKLALKEDVELTIHIRFAPLESLKEQFKPEIGVIKTSSKFWDKIKHL
ncbi:Tetratricopeptide repeat [Bacteroidales bacterium Barb6]|nr:Tetratricopeptide repeat [Bacteroidales bacterium Barb6]